MTSRSIHSIMRNIRTICNLKDSPFWNRSGTSAWKSIIVCIIMDGIDPCDPGTLDMLETIGLFQDARMNKDVNGKEAVVNSIALLTCKDDAHI